MSKLIYITKGRVTIVDDEDYEELSMYKWCATRGYPARRYSENKIKKTQLMHRQIMKAVKGQEIDHVNGDRLDNRKCNLRFVTRQQNMFNKIGCNITSKYKGVCWHKATNKWIAQINYNYKKLYLGIFNIEIDAAKAYNQKAKELFGEYAKLNEVG